MSVLDFRISHCALEAWLRSKTRMSFAAPRGHTTLPCAARAVNERINSLCLFLFIKSSTSTRRSCVRKRMIPSLLTPRSLKQLFVLSAFRYGDTYLRRADTNTYSCTGEGLINVSICVFAQMNERAPGAGASQLKTRADFLCTTMDKFGVSRKKCSAFMFLRKTSLGYWTSMAF
ncbi:unnamed protein product [Trichogramma brassicae]|uniref:Uncharacterized protein n=1 Tax=Trichogramma brassicae TaxID=86971 RepID=A0A6H5IW18_9HYME|nr:unnamed protein product [Trichogramma brassicae]